VPVAFDAKRYAGAPPAYTVARKLLSAEKTSTPCGRTPAASVSADAANSASEYTDAPAYVGVVSTVSTERVSRLAVAIGDAGDAGAGRGPACIKCGENTGANCTPRLRTAPQRQGEQGRRWKMPDRHLCLPDMPDAIGPRADKYAMSTGTCGGTKTVYGAVTL
jgi:hypothetical protein